MKSALLPAEVQLVVAEALGDAVGVRGMRELTEGTYNAAYAVRLSDGRELLLKVAPPAGTPVLSYERHLLATEAMCLQRFRGIVPVPELVASGTSALGREYLLTSLLSGASWQSQAHHLGGDRRRRLRRELGRHVAAMHSVTGSGPFGYPSGPLAAPTWREAYGRIIDALLADAARYAVALPVPAAELGERLHEAAADLLGDVRTPVLVHFDLWDGNVFVDLAGDEPVVTGLIDHERALWADPAADFVSLALLGDIAEDADFLAGYAEGGGPVVLDEPTRARLHLYRAHLALVMVVEAVPRGTAGPEEAGWNGAVARWLTGQLDALDDR